jgi:hypothetical protein
MFINRSKVILCIWFLFVGIFCSFGQAQSGLNGTWYYEETGTNEDFGEYTYTETLTIEGRNYTLIMELTKEYGPFNGWGEKGTFDISRPDIYFRPKYETNDIFGDDWEQLETGVVNKINTYRFEIGENILILIKNNARKIFRKI